MKHQRYGKERMVIRLPLLLGAGLAAAAAAVTPAIIGMTNNASFSEQLPVRLPAHASVAKFDSGPLETPGRSSEHQPISQDAEHAHDSRSADMTVPATRLEERSAAIRSRSEVTGGDREPRDDRRTRERDVGESARQSERRSGHVGPDHRGIDDRRGGDGGHRRDRSG